jgi:5-methylcytosine-specific restriction enzyme A
MPNAPDVACHCGRLNCTVHKAAARKEQRRFTDLHRKDDPYRAIYRTKQWQRTRAAKLSEDPLCRIAKLCVERFGVRMPSTDVDHIIPIREGGDPWASDNLQGACHADHAGKSAKEMRHDPNKQI